MRNEPGKDHKQVRGMVIFAFDKKHTPKEETRKFSWLIGKMINENNGSSGRQAQVCCFFYQSLKDFIPSSLKPPSPSTIQSYREGSRDAQELRKDQAWYQSPPLLTVGLLCKRSADATKSRASGNPRDSQDSTTVDTKVVKSNRPGTNLSRCFNQWNNCVTKVISLFQAQDPHLRNAYNKNICLIL
jgi:hypothetical protein